MGKTKKKRFGFYLSNDLMDIFAKLAKNITKSDLGQSLLLGKMVEYCIENIKDFKAWLEEK